MQFLISFLAVILTVYFATGASLPESQERKDNGIILDVAPKEVDGDLREGKTFPEDLSGRSFEIVVPVARNFSSLNELFQILSEDDHKEPRVATGTPPTYIKGSENNSSQYLIFFTDDVGKGN